MNTWEMSSAAKEFKTGSIAEKTFTVVSQQPKSQTALISHNDLLSFPIYLHSVEEILPQLQQCHSK